jgi:acetyl-CoA carboxylase carboxyl transferase subunit alpha
LKLTADDLRRFGVVDEIISEPLGGAHRNAEDVVKRTLEAIGAALTDLSTLTEERLMEERYRKYRRLGEWQADGLKPIGKAL